MADFIGENLAGSRFERTDLSGSEFSASSMSGSRFRNIDLTRSVLRGLELVDVEIDGLIRNVTINGVDIGPLIDAELDKRDPDRAKMRPADPAGFREAWDTVERLWEQTVARARRLPPELLDESVDGEWSFTETLRHLVFATDVWIRRAVLGDPAPWHPLDLPSDGLPDTPGVPADRAARPSLEEVLALRRDRMSTVRGLVDGLTDASLDTRTERVDAPGWPPPRSFPVRQCLLVILSEEWEHRRFAERDLAVLEARQQGNAGGRSLPA
jgi:DinB superfamily/Pentapeptide repeats (8 copies)